MKANLKQISTLILLISLLFGCTDSVPERDVTPKPDAVARSLRILIGKIVGDQPKLIMTDQALLESFFREAFPYASDNLRISKQPQGSYQPFQIEYDDLNAYNKRMYYLTALAIDDVQKPMFLRLELIEDRGSLFMNPDAGNVLHIHSCSHKGKVDGQSCDFLFTSKGFYDGCTCGGDVIIFDSRAEKH